ncbi:unnamed protein product [Urochloa humidicola]
MGARPSKSKATPAPAVTLPAPPWPDLPTEPATIVLRSLSSPADRFCFALVCRQWERVARQFWSGWSILPPELIGLVLRRLSGEPDRCRLAAVCRRAAAVFVALVVVCTPSGARRPSPAPPELPRRPRQLRRRLPPLATRRERLPIADLAAGAAMDGLRLGSRLQPSRREGVFPPPPGAPPVLRLLRQLADV